MRAMADEPQGIPLCCLGEVLRVADGVWREDRTPAWMELHSPDFMAEVVRRLGPGWRCRHSQAQVPAHDAGDTGPCSPACPRCALGPTCAGCGCLGVDLCPRCEAEATVLELRQRVTVLEQRLEEGGAPTEVALGPDGWCEDGMHDFDDEAMAAGRPADCRRCPAQATPLVSMVLTDPRPKGVTVVQPGRCAARKCRGDGVVTRTCGFCDGCCGHARGVCATPPEIGRKATPVEEPPECPGPDCSLCSGEACEKCGAGATRFPAVDGILCEHDVLERHERPSASGANH